MSISENNWNASFLIHLSQQKRNYLQNCLNEDITPHVSIITIFKKSEQDPHQYIEMNLSNQGLNDIDILPLLRTLSNDKYILTIDFSYNQLEQITCFFDLINDQNTIQAVILTGNYLNENHIQKLKNFAIQSEKNICIESESQYSFNQMCIQQQQQQQGKAQSLREQVLEKINQAKQNINNSASHSSSIASNSTNAQQLTTKQSQIGDNNSNTSQQSQAFNINSTLNSCQSNKTIQSPYQQLQQQQLPIQQVSSFKAGLIKQESICNQQQLNQQQQKISKVRTGVLLNSMVPPLDLQRIAVQKKPNAVTDRSLSPCNSINQQGLLQNQIIQNQQQNTERINTNEQNSSNRQPYHMVSGYFSSRQPYMNQQQSTTNIHGSKSPISNRESNQKILIMSRMNWLIEIRNIFEGIEKQGKASIQDLVNSIISKQEDFQLLEEEKYNEKYNELGLSVKDVTRELRYYKNQFITMDEIFNLVGNIQPEQAKIKRCINIFQQGDKTYEQIEKMRRKVNGSNGNLKANNQTSLERSNSQINVNGITIQTQLPFANMNSQNTLKTPKNQAIMNINSACNTNQNFNANTNNNNINQNNQQSSSSKHQHSQSYNGNMQVLNGNNLVKSRKNLQEAFQEQENLEKDDKIPTCELPKQNKQYFPSTRHKKRDQMRLKNENMINVQFQNNTNIEMSKSNIEGMSSPVNKTQIPSSYQYQFSNQNIAQNQMPNQDKDTRFIQKESDKQNSDILITLAQEELEEYKICNNPYQQNNKKQNKNITEYKAQNCYNLQNQQLNSNQQFNKIPPLPNSSRVHHSSNVNLPPKQNQLNRNCSSVGKFQSPQCIKKLSSNQSSGGGYVNNSLQFKSPEKSIRDENNLSPSQYFVKPIESIKKHSTNDLLNNLTSNSKKIKNSQSQSNIIQDQQQQLNNLYQNQHVFTNNLVQSTTNNYLLNSSQNTQNTNSNNNYNNVNSLKNNTQNNNNNIQIKSNVEIQKLPININNIQNQQNNAHIQEKRINTEDHDIETARFHREDSLKQFDSIKKSNQPYFTNSNEDKKKNSLNNEENILNSKSKKVIVITQQQQAEALAFSQRGMPPKKALQKVSSQCQLLQNPINNLQHSNTQSALSSTRANQSNDKCFVSLSKQQMQLQQQQQQISEVQQENQQIQNIQRQSSSLTLKQQLKQLGLQGNNQQQNNQQIQDQFSREKQQQIQSKQQFVQQNKQNGFGQVMNNESGGNVDYMINSPFSTQMNISAIKMNESCMKNVTLQDIATELMALGETNNKDIVDISKLMQTTTTVYNNTSNLAASTQNINNTNIFNSLQAGNNAAPNFASGNSTPKVIQNQNQNMIAKFSNGTICANNNLKNEQLECIMEKVVQENTINQDEDDGDSKQNSKKPLKLEESEQSISVQNQNEQITPSASPTLNNQNSHLIQSVQSDDDRRELTFSSRAMQKIMKKRQFNFNQNSINSDSISNANQNNSRVSFQQNCNSYIKNLNTSANLSSNTKYNNDPNIFSFNDSANKHFCQNIQEISHSSQNKQDQNKNISEFQGSNQIKTNMPPENLRRILDKEFPTGLIKQQDEIDDSLADFLVSNNLSEYINFPKQLVNNNERNRESINNNQNKQNIQNYGVYSSFGNKNQLIQNSQENYSGSMMQKSQSFINISSTQQISNIENEQLEIQDISRLNQLEGEDDEVILNEQSTFSRLQFREDEENSQLFDEENEDESDNKKIKFNQNSKQKVNKNQNEVEDFNKKQKSNFVQQNLLENNNLKEKQQNLVSSQQEYPLIFGENQILTQSYNDESSNFFTVKSQFEKTSIMFKDLVKKMNDDCSRNLSENKRQLLQQVCNYIPYEDNELPFYAIKFDYIKENPEHIEILSSQLMRQYFQNAQAVKITFSQIEKIPQFSSITNQNLLHNNLRILNLSFNSIKSLKSITTSDLHNLEFLNISYNYLENLDGLEDLYKLRELHAQNNQISFIHSKNTAPLEQIRQIDLQNNLLPNLEALVALQQNKFLELLNFQGNPLTQFPNYSKQVSKLLNHVKAIDIPDPNIIIYTLSDYSKYREICFIEENELKTFQMRQQMKQSMIKNSQEVQKKVQKLTVNTNDQENQANKFNQIYQNNMPQNLQSPSKKILQYRSLSPQSNNQFQSFAASKIQQQSSFYFQSSSSNQNQQQTSQSLKQSNINQIQQVNHQNSLADNQDCKESYYFQTERGSHSSNHQQMKSQNNEIYQSSTNISSNLINQQKMPQSIQLMKKSICSVQSENSLPQQNIESIIQRQKLEQYPSQLNLQENLPLTNRQKSEKQNNSREEEQPKILINYKKQGHNIYQLSQKNELIHQEDTQQQFSQYNSKDKEYFYQDENVNEINIQHSQSQNQFFVQNQNSKISQSYQPYQSTDEQNKQEGKKLFKNPSQLFQQNFQNLQTNQKQTGQLSQMIKMKIGKAQQQFQQQQQQNPKKF
ncbi:hypothetical protein TTHERM_00829340 (macronuclear) [Tetrahymena thermophila SB210]|uniref:Leucine rich repeat protein n=1 Tax=Tetrahymena thermophila (strain SB210) TaxID=312017 RepID=Q23A88_TETTS|nr:hypothetical protein TTHERM_00829340 [Tetrahymena thermophila SB210]EAR93392.2 hypothetical protein TTHERM_00829340 [Tetrahymena thermophila SB210]|eukprot:XP_001013637.2 hypothetical protein TTHERM_00829340 [Tetrahymena thermophila SB210]